MNRIIKNNQIILASSSIYRSRLLKKYIKNFSNPILSPGYINNIAYIIQSRPNYKYQVINNYDEITDNNNSNNITR